MGNLRRRVERLEGGYGRERRAFCRAWAAFLTENGKPMTAEEMDAEIPAGVASYEDWLRCLESGRRVIRTMQESD
jgi:hypothetical protein